MFNFALIIVCFLIIIHKVDLFQWKNIYARSEYQALFRRIGKPQIFNEGSGGIAIWTSHEIAKRIILLDKPGKPLHLCIPIEIFAGYECMDITKKVRSGRLSELFRFSPDISYDPLTKGATIKTYTYPQGMALAALMLKLTTNELTLNWIREHNLIQKYEDKSSYKLKKYEDEILEYKNDYC